MTRRLDDRRRSAVVALPFVLVTALTLVGATGADPDRRQFDLRIYLLGLHDYLDTGSPYHFLTRKGLGFTYPPFSLLPVLPLQRLSLDVAWALWVIAIAATAWATTRLLIRQVAPDCSAAVSLAVAAIVAVTEPVLDSMWLGQVSPFVAAAAFASLALPNARAGALAGLGAALKVTPLTALPAMALLPDRGRRALWAAGTALAATAVGFALTPGGSRYYFSTGLWETSRVGNLRSPSNNSLPGLLAHLGVSDEAALATGIVAAGALALGWLLIAGPGSRHDRVGLAAAVGIVTVLATPIAWGHHALAVSLGLALLLLRGRPVVAVAGALLWALPVLIWARDAETASLRVALQVVRPASAVVVLLLLAQQTRRLSRSAQ